MVSLVVTILIIVDLIGSGKKGSVLSGPVLHLDDQVAVRVNQVFFHLLQVGHRLLQTYLTKKSFNRKATFTLKDFNEQLGRESRGNQLKLVDKNIIEFFCNGV